MSQILLPLSSVESNLQEFLVSDPFFDQFMVGAHRSPEFIESVWEVEGIVYEPVLFEVDGQWFLDGRQRINALRACYERAKSSGDKTPSLFEKVTCKVMIGLDTYTAQQLTLSLNSQRSDNPLHDFYVINDFVTKGMGLNEIAKHTGKSVPTMKRIMTLGAVHADILDAANELTEKGKPKVTISNLFAIAKKPRKFQAKLVALLERQGYLTSKDIASVGKAKAEVATLVVTPVDLLRQVYEYLQNGEPVPAEWQTRAAHALGI